MATDKKPSEELIKEDVDKKERKSFLRKKAENSDVRTKDVFGKKLGKTNIIVLLILVFAVVFVGRYFIMKQMDEKIDVANKEVQQWNAQQNAYLNNVNNRVVIDFEVGKNVKTLPTSYQYKNVDRDVTLALLASGFDSYSLTFDLKKVSEEQNKIIEGTSADIMSVKHTLTVNFASMDNAETFLNKIYATETIYYIDSCKLSVFESGYKVDMIIYSFYSTTGQVAAAKA